MISYAKGIPLSFLTTAAAIVPSALYHGASLRAAIILTLLASGLAIFVDWANAWRFRWEPHIRPRWFYLNLTAPAVLVLVIQAVGWRTFSANDTSARVLFGRITSDHLLACSAALAAVLAWVFFSLHLRKKEPNKSPETNALPGQ